MKKITLLIVLLLVVSIGLIACQSEEPEPVEPPTVKKQEISLYFTDVALADIYRERQTVQISEDELLEMVALESWIKGPNSNMLTPLVSAETEVLSVESVDGVAEVNFSKEIQDSQVGSTGEAYILQQIVMIMEQFGYESTQILVEGEIIESLFGHVVINEPLFAFPQSAYLDIELLESGEIVAQNATFKLFSPAHNSVQPLGTLVVKGLARVWEASFSYELVDSADVSISDNIMASEGAPGWGEFEFVIDLDDNFVGPCSLTLYESSAVDGSPINQLEVEFDLED